jgi:cation:H+ antiporter
MFVPILLLLASAAVIYFACELFINGVEWVGRKAGVAETAVGTILAAFGTALPESVVTFVAVAFGHSHAAKEIGVGAALGGPLVLSTIAYAVVGLVLWFSQPRAKSSMPVISEGTLARDQAWFMVIFVFKVGLGLVAFSWKPWLGIAFLAAYACYVWSEMRTGEATSKGELEPLKLRPRQADPSLGWAVTQTLLSLAFIFGASQLFVHQLEKIGPWLGVAPSLVALLLSPIATELPETMNAVIWVRQGKTRLALANISGAMMIQATVPSAFGIFFTPWLLEPALIWAAGITLLAVAGLFLLLKRKALTASRLAMFGLLYLIFAAGLFWKHPF